MNSIRISGSLLLTVAIFSGPATAGAAVFGSVVAIGGTASDIALDEPRGVLYIADFGASVIDVMSTTDNTVHSSINVLPFPGAIALSFDDQYLLVAHYCNVATTTTTTTTTPACSNAVTSIALATGSQQVFSLAGAPLGVAFLGNGQAVIVTTTSVLLFTPATGSIQLVTTLANVAQTLSVPLATFPGQVVQAALASSADGSTVWGIASAGTASQLLFQYYGSTASISGSLYTTSPTLLPRISTSADGTYATVGYALVQAGGVLLGRYPNVIQASNITGSVIDSVHGRVYGQFPDANQPTGPPTGLGTSGQSAMLIMDSDNLTFRDRISIPENMVGRAVLNAAATMMYAVSDSGVMILPVGSLNSSHRLAAAQEDILVATNFCNTGVLSQSLTITDPGGGQTDFAISASQPGVTILPASGVTPATVQVLVNPAVVPASGGTTAITLNLTSRSAVNQPKPVRLLVNNPDPSQRGAIVDQPGILTDILPDQIRNRVYVVRQDMNQVQVFDGSSMSLIATLRTATSPTMMAMTADGSRLLVGHDDSELVTIYDLNRLQPLAPVAMPGGHFARSIAVSNAAILALVRNEGGTPVGMIDSIRLALSSGVAAALPTLGVYANSIPTSTGVLASSPSGANIFFASPDGNVALYTAAANTFVASRHDFTSLSGAFAASDFGWYVAGNAVLDASLVPSGTLSASPLPTSGFSVTGPGGYLTSAASPAAAGSLMQVASLQTGSGGRSSILMTEAPVLPAAGSTSSTSSSSSTSTSAGPIYGTYGAGTASLHALTSFSRTVAPLPGIGSVAVMTTSGITVLASSYPATALPSISAVISAADGSKAVAPGGLISIYGQNMSTLSLAASSIPLSTGLGNSCIGVNGAPIPLLYVSSVQINAQLPFSAEGNTTLTIHSPGGTSNNYNLTIQPTAPSVFMSGSAGPQTGLALVVRDNNSQLVTPTNPINPKDTLTIYLTGMGQTAPAISAGQAAPGNPLSWTSVPPVITLGGMPLSVLYSGLAPGEVGVYQINATVPSGVPAGLAIPLVITQGGGATTLNVRVIN